MTHMLCLCVGDKVIVLPTCMSCPSMNHCPCVVVHVTIQEMYLQGKNVVTLQLFASLKADVYHIVFLVLFLLHCFSVGSVMLWWTSRLMWYKWSFMHLPDLLSFCFPPSDQGGASVQWPVSK